MRRVRGVAHQHDGRGLAPSALLRQCTHSWIDHARKSDPLRRAAQMRGIRQQRIAVQILCKQLLAEGDAVFLAHFVETGRAPDAFRRFDDEGGGLIVETVGVGLEPAPFGFFEGEGECVEELLRTEPDEAAIAHVDIRLISRRILLTNRAIGAVAGDDQVGFVSAVVRHLGFEHQLDAEFFATRLQDVQKPLAADAAEAVARRADLLAAEMDLDVVPVIEGVENRVGAGRVGRAQVAERLVREHHAPAERVIGPVAFDDRHFVLRIAALHQQPKVQAGGASPDTDDTHAHTPVGI